MKNIYTILEEVGLTVPEDKKQSFDTSVHENYKTVRNTKERSMPVIISNHSSTPLTIPFPSLKRTRAMWKISQI